MISVHIHANNRFAELWIRRLNDVVVQMFLDTAYSKHYWEQTVQKITDLADWVIIGICHGRRSATEMMDFLSEDTIPVQILRP